MDRRKAPEPYLVDYGFVKAVPLAAPIPDPHPHFQDGAIPRAGLCAILDRRAAARCLVEG